MWMIYGANGYSGRLIAFDAKRRGHSPILAGRNRHEVKKMANSMSLSFQNFSLEDRIDWIAEKLKGVDVLLNCAGPFSQTHERLLAACLKSGTHYLDITGELDVFENIFAFDEQAKLNNICLIPGVGFDVVPTDALSLHLKEKHPTADQLELYIEPKGGLSPGTIKTLLEGFGKSSRIRKNGHLSELEDFKVKNWGGLKRAVPISFGDLSSAFRSTEIPNIQTYLITNVAIAQLLKALSLLKTPFSDEDLLSKLRFLIDRTYSGPRIGQLRKTNAFIEGRVFEDGRLLGEKKIKTLNAYEVTALTAILCIEKLIEKPLAPGAYSPAQAFGSKYLLEALEI